eukprot:229387-Chlamydomonas_euryale.AAC.1
MGRAGIGKRAGGQLPCCPEASDSHQHLIHNGKAKLRTRGPRSREMLEKCEAGGVGILPRRSVLLASAASALLVCGMQHPLCMVARVCLVDRVGSVSRRPASLTSPLGHVPSGMSPGEGGQAVVVVVQAATSIGGDGCGRFGRRGRWRWWWRAWQVAVVGG